MKTQTLHMNVYRAGYYHRQGKPGHTNLHAGDFFTSMQSAVDAIEHQRGYITTVSFEMPVPEGTTILENPPGSVPDPLSTTRNNPLALMPWHSSSDLFPIAILGAGVCPMPGGSGWESLEPAEDPLGMTYEEWRAERERTGFQPSPRASRPLPALLRPAHLET